MKSKPKKTTLKQAVAQSIRLKKKAKAPLGKAKQNAAIKRLLIEKGGLNKEWARKHLVVIS